MFIELNEYGASPPPDNLLPTVMRDTNIFGINASYQVQQRIPDFRRYEIKDHLGNVRTVIADYKNPESTTGTMLLWKYKADVKNISNMYPYGKSYGTNAIYNAAEDYRYGFNGMEKEKNMDASGDITDFGARFLDSEFPIFGKPDPLEIILPNESPYLVLGANPINHVDPDGNFKRPIHEIITENAFNNSYLGEAWGNLFKSSVKYGASFYADIIGGASNWHFDGKENYSEVISVWKDLSIEVRNIVSDLDILNKEFGGRDAIRFGKAIHTVQDFYSHSNYVELYIKYYKVLNGESPKSVPIFDVNNGGSIDEKFKQILKDELRTGDFHLIDNEVFNPFFSDRIKQPTSHNKMNKDNADTEAGKLAKDTATEHTKQIINTIK